MSDFTAFPAQTRAFLKAVAANNSKEWFEANRELYEAGYVAPARAFIDAVGPQLQKIAPGISYEPRNNGSISRINRDVRFSKDKRPYKDHLDIWFWHGGKRGWDKPGFYLRIKPDVVILGSGMHVMKDGMLDRFRAAVVDAKAGTALEKAAAAIGSYEIGGATRRQVPRGFDAGHARAAYLLHDGLYAGLEASSVEVEKPGFADRAVAHWKATWPIGQWLADWVAAG